MIYTVWKSIELGPGLLSEIHVEIQQGFSNMTSEWLVAVLPANRMPGLKTNMDFNMVFK